MEMSTNNKNAFFSQVQGVSSVRNDAVEKWYADEGQLLCDVYEDGNDIVVRSTIAGVEPSDIDISVAHDVLTIRGRREMDEEIGEEKFYSRECYWGSFSRSIILPHEIDQKGVKADLKNGVLTVILPKKYKSSTITIRQANG